MAGTVVQSKWALSKWAKSLKKKIKSSTTPNKERKVNLWMWF